MAEESNRGKPMVSLPSVTLRAGKEDDWLVESDRCYHLVNCSGPGDRGSQGGGVRGLQNQF